MYLSEKNATPATHFTYCRRWNAAVQSELSLFVEPRIFPHLAKNTIDWLIDPDEF